MEKISIVGLDIAKTSFHAHGAAGDESKVFSKALPRGRALGLFSQIEPCTVALEACAGAHYWSREISKLGHDVRLIAPKGPRHLPRLEKAEAENGEHLPPEVIGLCQMFFDLIAELSKRIDEMTRRFRQIARQNDVAKRLMTMPGIGPVTAVSIAVLAAPPEIFSKGGDFAD